MRKLRPAHRRRGIINRNAMTRAGRSAAKRGPDMTIVVIDAQGGGIGKQLVAAIKKEIQSPGVEVLAVGTNSLATSAMLKAGADHGATGENAVLACCRRADVIVGPIGIAIADALWGEISPAMAAAVGSSPAKRILLPMNHCDNIVVGVSNLNTGVLIREAVEQIAALLARDR